MKSASLPIFSVLMAPLQAGIPLSVIPLVILATIDFLSDPYKNLVLIKPLAVAVPLQFVFTTQAGDQ